jgi:TetR/AcrR family transcriptional regulator, tetracycline repressor protein
VPLDRILTTALRCVDEEGADALSMRTLAQRLNSGTATLYRHFTDRAHLVALVVDHVFGEAELDHPALSAMTWDEACRTVARTMFDVLGRHPNVAPLLVEQVPLGPNALALRERCIAVLLGNGFRPDTAARTYALLARYVLGFAIQLGGERAGDRAGAEKAAGAFRDLDPERFPATLAVAGSMPVPLEEEFGFGLDLILGGLSQQLGGD